MKINISTTANAYEKAISTLLQDMQSSYDKYGSDFDTSTFKSKLNHLYTTYDKDEEISNQRYKLYEARAYLWYMEGDSTNALDSMRQAVQIKGSDFSEASDFINMIASQQQNTNLSNSKIRLYSVLFLAVSFIIPGSGLILWLIYMKQYNLPIWMKCVIFILFLLLPAYSFMYGLLTGLDTGQNSEFLIIGIIVPLFPYVFSFIFPKGYVNQNSSSLQP
jgi:cation transport ATPase